MGSHLYKSQIIKAKEKLVINVSVSFGLKFY
jgi:hypothetical protein